MRRALTISRLAAAVFACGILTAAQPPSVPLPDPRLTPEEVVGVVLEALRANDRPTPGHGIAVTFAFSSPANREATGPLERFTALVQSERYRPMLNHRSVERGVVKILGNEARERVVLTGEDGTRAAYVFTLSRQGAGPYKDCWMTDGVVREASTAALRGVLATE